MQPSEHAARWRRIRTIGQGAFGEVILGEHVDDGTQVAIKQVYLRGGGGARGQPAAAPDPAAREADALQAIRHPNVVALLDMYHEGACLCMVQELCSTDLAHLLDACYSPLPPPILKALLQQALRAVAAVHAAGIMHRDIKPGNLLLHPSGVLKLGDFGQARPLGGHAPPWGEGVVAAELTPTVATRWYRAPELLYGARRYGPAVDVWALGMVAAEMFGLAPLVAGTSDIDQLARLQRTLGTIGPETWPEVVDLPDWGKICFDPCPGRPLPQLLPLAPPAALHLLQSMLRYPPDHRPTAQQALLAPYFTEAPPPASAAEVAAFTAAALQLHEATEARVEEGVRGAARALSCGAGAGGAAPSAWDAAPAGLVSGRGEGPEW